ncbi:MAG: hypothetical protein ACOCUT_02175 [bacterium]
MASRYEGMTKVYIFLKPSSICLFDLPDLTVSSNPLRYFIRFLQSVDENAILDFAYVPDTPNLIDNLSARENILIDHSPPPHMRIKGEDLKDIVTEGNNPHLIKLMDYLPNLDCMPYQLSMEDKKLLSLMKGILSTSSLLVLHSPEKYLHIDLIHLLQKAILHETRFRQKTIVLCGKQTASWQEITDTVIFKNENSIFECSTELNNVISLPFHKQDKAA